MTTKALEVGCRHIDTAQMYQNEAGVGDAIRDSGIAREGSTSPATLNNGFHRPDDAKRAFDETMQRLGLDRIDLPDPLAAADSVRRRLLSPRGAPSPPSSTTGARRPWASPNFQPAHLERIIEETGVVPAVNQIEVHPYFGNEAAARPPTTAVSPSRRGHRSPGSRPDDEVIGKIAAAHGKTVSQVTLRWHVGAGTSSSQDDPRGADARELRDLRLLPHPDEVAAISGLGPGAEGRRGPDRTPSTGSPTDRKAESAHLARLLTRPSRRIARLCGAARRADSGRLGEQDAPTHLRGQDAPTRQRFSGR